MDPSWESLVSISPIPGDRFPSQKVGHLWARWPVAVHGRREASEHVLLEDVGWLYEIYLYLSGLCGIWRMLDGNPLVLTNGLLCNK